MKDYKIPELDIVIEKGTSLLISTAALHLDAQYFDEPEKFMPERFDEKVAANKSFVEWPYMPFGDGPRTCIAMKLAKLQTKIAIVLLLRKFHFELGAQHIGKDMKMDPRAIAKLPIGGVNLKVKSR